MSTRRITVEEKESLVRAAQNDSVVVNGVSISRDRLLKFCDDIEATLEEAAKQREMES